MKIYNLKNIFLFLFFLIPLSLVTGPAIPDLTITFGGIFGIVWILLKENKTKLIKYNLVKISIVFWFSLIFLSFFFEYDRKIFTRFNYFF